MCAFQKFEVFCERPIGVMEGDKNIPMLSQKLFGPIVLLCICEQVNVWSTFFFTFLNVATFSVEWIYFLKCLFRFSIWDSRSNLLLELRLLKKVSTFPVWLFASLERLEFFIVYTLKNKIYNKNSDHCTSVLDMKSPIQ